MLCGPKGNGKTLRLERAAASFVPGWVTMSGPRSAKAGMQGNSDSINGCNAVYDEMIDDLRENGGNQIEYMKQILLNRKYVYVKAMPQKSEDGLESHATWKIETDHWETHCAYAVAARRVLHLPCSPLPSHAGAPTWARSSTRGSRSRAR